MYCDKEICVDRLAIRLYYHFITYKTYLVSRFKVIKQYSENWRERVVIMAKANSANNSDSEEKIWQQIREKTDNIQYGTVTITVHDGRITQVEASTKLRFDR